MTWIHSGDPEHSVPDCWDTDKQLCMYFALDNDYNSVFALEDSSSVDLTVRNTHKDFDPIQ